eukprot:TRINITY_DN3664_c0_g1_i1.p1 TRINITY_DN3664_c0_g1~~TRINITY_DN3664_c0_g1_i1.p1  ORF type:complete len:482 (-),score=118.16 TRINITY_DN3664_c0_g1_i1:865-2253(-)
MESSGALHSRSRSSTHHGKHHHRGEGREREAPQRGAVWWSAKGNDALYAKYESSTPAPAQLVAATATGTAAAAGASGGGENAANLMASLLAAATTAANAANAAAAAAAGAGAGQSVSTPLNWHQYYESTGVFSVDYLAYARLMQLHPHPALLFQTADTTRCATEEERTDTVRRFRQGVAELFAQQQLPASQHNRRSSKKGQRKQTAEASVTGTGETGELRRPVSSVEIVVDAAKPGSTQEAAGAVMQAPADVPPGSSPSLNPVTPALNPAPVVCNEPPADETVSISGYEVDSGTASAVALALRASRTLTSLSFWGSSMSPASARAILDAAGCSTGLLSVALDVTAVPLQMPQEVQPQLPDVSAPAQLQLLHLLPVQTKTLDWSGCALGSFATPACHVQHLSLRGNNLGDAQAKVIAELLKANTSLQTLDMWDNAIGDEGAFAIAGSLKINTTLVTLSLSRNR